MLHHGAHQHIQLVHITVCRPDAQETEQIAQCHARRNRQNTQKQAFIQNGFTDLLPCCPDTL